jgi:hypothetical protein
MNEHELARIEFLETSHHRVEVDRVRIAIVVRVGLERQPRKAQQRQMIRP